MNGDVWAWDLGLTTEAVAVVASIRSINGPLEFGIHCGLVGLLGLVLGLALGPQQVGSADNDSSQHGKQGPLDLSGR